MEATLAEFVADVLYPCSREVSGGRSLVRPDPRSPQVPDSIVRAGAIVGTPDEWQEWWTGWSFEERVEKLWGIASPDDLDTKPPSQRSRYENWLTGGNAGGRLVPEDTPQRDWWLPLCDELHAEVDKDELLMEILRHRNEGSKLDTILRRLKPLVRQLKSKMASLAPADNPTRYLTGCLKRDLSHYYERKAKTKAKG